MGEPVSLLPIAIWYVYLMGGLTNFSTSAEDVGTNTLLWTSEARPVLAAQVERVPSADLMIEAELFRQTLRLHFGEGAETNRAITAPVVKTYFVGKRYTGTITAADLADATLLNDGFAKLAAWTGDGTSWTFPFHLIPTNLPAAVKSNEP